jgi:hypothetical protein
LKKSNSIRLDLFTSLVELNRGILRLMPKCGYVLDLLLEMFGSKSVNDLH